ncbi:MAG: glutamate synthase subunit beta [Lachnospiraceae bacterium]|nr:glutamate synthase subunit beta [Lachnospiraceae bacterium]
MGKPTGFLEYERKSSPAIPPKERIKNWEEFHTPLPEKERTIQASRCMACGVPFCQAGADIMGRTTGCPLHNLIPEWNDLIYRGNWREAYRRLRKTNSFPEFTGRVCPALCEVACTCNLGGDPVGGKETELAIIERAYREGWAAAEPPAVRTGKRIAIVGSGPSGLSAADLLNRRGHNVTVFERFDRPGGLLMYGIPNMKLEKRFVERKLKILEEEGIRFVTGADVGKNVKADEILADHDRVLLACGASKPRDLNAPGRDAEGIFFAVDFLRENTKALLDSDFRKAGSINAKGKQVVIVGGGDTGNDCLGTCIRHGAKSVVQIEMMPKPPEKRTDDNPWPEWPNVLKTDYGQEEAIEVFGSDPRIYETTVREFLKDKAGKLRAIRTVRLSWETENGRRVMKEIPGSEQELPCELLLIAAGFVGAQDYIAEAFGVQRDNRGNIATAPGEFGTSVTGVFCAGDMHTGQSLVVKAIRQGREAARAIDLDLMGYTNLIVQ